MSKVAEVLLNPQYNIGPIQLLRSNAGWYIGRLTSSGVPYCRCSTCYFSSPEAASNALITGTYLKRCQSCELFGECNGEEEQ